MNIFTVRGKVQWDSVLYVITFFWFFIFVSFMDNANADDIEGMWLTTGEWSRHNDESKHQYRQNNTGIGVQFDLNSDQSVVAGYYNNSIHRETVYMGMTYTPFHLGDAKFGVVGAMATGYCQYVPAVPIGGAYATYEQGRFGVGFMWLPTVVMAVNLKIRLF